MRTTLMTAVIAAAVAAPAVGQFTPSRPEQGPRVLYYEALPVPPGGDSTHARVDVHYRIDREFFVPVRDQEGHSPFHRSGEIVVELADSTGTVASRAMAALEIPENDADRKPLGTLWEQGILSLATPPGRYRMLVTLEDEESRRNIMDSSRFVRVPPRPEAGIATAGAVLVSPPREAGPLPAAVTLTNFGGEILFGRPAALFVTWKPGAAADSALHVRYSFAEVPPAAEDTPLLPPDGEITVPVERGVRLEPSVDSAHAGYDLSRVTGDGVSCAVVPLPIARLLLRSYTMKFTLSSGSGTCEIVAHARAVWPDMPFSLKDVDNAIDALRYITTVPELDSLRSGNMEERRANLERFWRLKGGKQETAFNDVMTEYYRRADRATREFGTLRQPDGFRSDRGRIYVLYGPPGATDRSLDPVSGFQETWTYPRLGKKFIFVDHAKSGNYVLVSTTAL